MRQRGCGGRRWRDPSFPSSACGRGCPREARAGEGRPMNSSPLPARSFAARHPLPFGERGKKRGPTAPRTSPIIRSTITAPQARSRDKEEPPHGRHRPQDHRRGHQPALQLGARAAGVRRDGRGFRAARRLPPPAQLSPRARPAGARQIRARRAAGDGRQQHPLSHLDQDRRVGARQDLPLGAAHALVARSDPVGLRLGRRASQALCAVAQAGELQGRVCSACAARCRRRSA